MKLLNQPTGLRLGDWLNENLDRDWEEFRAAVAFVKRSGVKHIVERLTEFAKSQRVEIIAGVDHQGTSYEGLKLLMDAVSPNGRVVIFHNELRHTFHPKVYLFNSPNRAAVAVGSGNLTEGGLYTNYEAGAQIDINLRDAVERKMFEDIEGTLDSWIETTNGTSMELDDERLDNLVETGFALREADMRHSFPRNRTTGSKASDKATGSETNPFKGVTVPPAPPSTQPDLVPDRSQSAGPYYAMTLQTTDAGVGQMTAGAARRSPEIFIPLKARNADPGFWEWKDGFDEDPQRAGKFDRRGVRMRIGNDVVEVNMMTWPVKSDFRLRSEALRSLGSVGDILVIEKVPSGTFDYDVSIVKSGSTEYATILEKCDQNVRNSRKVFGYF